MMTDLQRFQILLEREMAADPSLYMDPFDDSPIEDVTSGKEEDMTKEKTIFDADEAETLVMSDEDY